MSTGDSNSKGATPQMNITPLVDVVLVLLIIFMVVTPLLAKNFALHLPKKEENVPPPPPGAEENLVVTVHKDGTIFVNRLQVDKSELAPKLSRLLAAKTDKAIYFDAEDGTPYGKAVEAMDLARGGGAKTVAILTEKMVP
ncbi:MAG: biopolymer transporter ExbD [Polyangiaceae bacterium]